MTFKSKRVSVLVVLLMLVAIVFVNTNIAAAGDGTGKGGGKATKEAETLAVSFSSPSLNPSATLICLDFSKGVDDNLEANVSQIKVYEKSNLQEVNYADYKYVKEGNTETGDKMRRIELSFNDLQANTTYILEVGASVVSNNGTALGETKSFEFTTEGGEPAEEPDTSVQFNDIDGHWAAANIKEMVALGAISGYPDGRFAPDQSISRAEFVTVLVNAFQLESVVEKSFTDTENHWAKAAIATAYNYDIINGYSDSSFGPDDPITREQMAVMIIKAAKLAATGETAGFVDSNQISPWAVGAVNTAYYNQLMSGYPDQTFRPANHASRAEAVSVILSALK